MPGIQTKEILAFDVVHDPPPPPQKKQSMKVLLINNIFYHKGGSEAVMFNTAELLEHNGCEVVFFSFERPENQYCRQECYFPELGNNLRRVINYFWNSDASRNLSRLIDAEHPDIAHVHLFWGGLSPSILDVLKKHNIPIVHSVHDYRMICPAYTFKDGNGQICEQCYGGKFYKCTVNRCSKGNLIMSAMMAAEMYCRNKFHHPANYIDKFLFVSRFSQNMHLKFDKRFTKDKSMVLYNCANSGILKYRNCNNDTYGSYYLFYGRLSFEKGISTLIRAFGQHPELKLKIVGAGPLERCLKDECRKLNNTSIEFVGYKTGKDLYELVANAKFVCVPSEWYENNPMTIVESYSLRTPVIAAAIGGITEIVEEGKTGLLFKSGNVIDLCRAIVKSKELSEASYLSMKNNAESFAEENFNENIYYNKLIETYNDVIESCQGISCTHS